MRLGTIAQAELLDRLGVKGADLYRFTIQDFAVPVVVIADTSGLSAVPQRRQLHYSEAIAAQIGLAGVLEIVPLDVAIEVVFKNDGPTGGQVCNVVLVEDTQVVPGLIEVLPVASYQTPEVPNPRFLLRSGTVAGYAGLIVENLPVNNAVSVSQRYRVSPGRKMAIIGSLVNVVATLSVHVEEFAGYERSR